MNQSENGLANSGVPKPYDSDSAISPLARAVINEHIKKIETKYKDLNLSRQKAIDEMRRGRHRKKVNSVELEVDSSGNDAGNEEKKVDKVEIKIRPPPDVRVKSIIRYQLCKHVARYGSCNRGDECVFAHSKEELQIWEKALEEKRSKVNMPTKLKHILSPRMCPPGIDNPDVEYKMCNILYKNEFCHFGDKCRFAHSSEELLLWRTLKRQGILHNKPKSSDNSYGGKTKFRKSPSMNRALLPRSRDAYERQYSNAPNRAGQEHSPGVSPATQFYPHAYIQNNTMNPPGYVNYLPTFGQQYLPVMHVDAALHQQ